ncbi:2-hydroxyacid dehydrogenase [Achromobacter aloeverae]|uniref:Glyoxylate/hydroxypyruvate reductase A n=1 Tax=Achromobacter aloeverae TaxID=1750518 RepID=A0A4V1MSL1_9BURK|nr:glyoxylate/hydroxypyruvate reductase A [Achromobacter aloeverae]RXN92420.1 glyoxylate/hydroxypyruvate reductase A [Achromobacter aloeverae]
MNRVALLSRSANLAYFQPLLNAVDPGLEVVTWPDPACLRAEVAVCWNPPPGVYARMPALRLIHSIAAGVDNVLAGQDTRGLPVCRVVDPMLAQGMLQYVLWAVLHFHRKLDLAMANQRQAVWQRPCQQAAADFRVGLMGLGELGGLVAATLPGLGYAVNGWSRTPRDLPGIRMFSGADGYEPFLRQTDLLVCLLPLTEATRGILDRRTFAALPSGAAVVNCGRGEHLVAEDLIDALASGHLRGAVLDVFTQEPLAPDHPLWRTPGVVVTPHMATMASSETVAAQVLANIQRLRDGQALVNQVDLARGY